jgi:hypothetical protein
VRDLVSAYRVVTLTGPGGIGKTSLAIKAVRYLLPDFEDGGWIVELASLSDPGLVPSTVAPTLGLKVTGEISAEFVRAVFNMYRLCFPFQEWNDDRDSLLGLLLHDPVARIVDNRAANVGCSKADFRCQVSAIRMVTADRKYGKRQLALCHQPLIVDRILRKRRKLSTERIVNGAGPSA